MLWLRMKVGARKPRGPSQFSVFLLFSLPPALLVTPMFLKGDFHSSLPTLPEDWAGVEGELRGKGEMEIPLKLAIVEDATCRTETTNLWLQILSRKDAFSAPPPTLHSHLEHLGTQGTFVSWNMK